MISTSISRFVCAGTKTKVLLPRQISMDLTEIRTLWWKQRRRDRVLSPSRCFSSSVATPTSLSTPSSTPPCTNTNTGVDSPPPATVSQCTADRLPNPISLTALNNSTPALPTSFYRRPLPRTAIAFSSPEGKQLFKEALEEGHMNGYFALAEQYNTQQEPAYCGLASLSMCLNALNIDPNRLWKGPWRWFSEDMLDCCVPIELVKKRGVTFTEFSCLGRCNGARIEAFRQDQSTIEHFRAVVKEACSSQKDFHIVAAYSRKVLGQTGDGHYSPIGGYSEKKDLVLLLDVARFKHPPHWVPMQSLWDAMAVHDSFTTQSRGYFLISRNDKYSCASTCKVSESPSLWKRVAAQLNPIVPELAAECEKQAQLRHEEYGVKNVITVLLVQLLSRFAGEQLVSEELSAEVITHIRSSEMFGLVQEVLEGERSELLKAMSSEIATLVLLATPSHIFSALSPVIREQLVSLRHLDAMPTALRDQVMMVREEMYQLMKRCFSCPHPVGRT